MFHLNSRFFTKWGLIFSLVGTILLGPISHVEAGTSMVAKGLYATLTSSETFFKSVRNKSHYAEALTLTYMGGLSGNASDSGIFIVYPDGSYSGYGTETCISCTIGGHTGSFSARYQYRGSGITYSGNLTFTSASGGLKGLEGGGMFQGDASGNQIYAYRYSFESDK